MRFGAWYSMPGSSRCISSVTPNASTSTAAIDTGAAQRFESDGFAATARRDAARIASSNARGGSSRGSAR